ncbi:MAG: hypothetical protein ACJAYN_000141 [Bermanella sp.]
MLLLRKYKGSRIADMLILITMSFVLDGIGGFVQSSWETDVFSIIENNTGLNISVDVTVDIT